jgi:lactococcin 972 family bacteriocin
MSKLARTLGTAIVTAGLTFGIAGVALAEVVSVGGGTWDYGSGLPNVWSNYSHDSVRHYSSVATGGGSSYRAPCTPPGYTSLASINKAPWDHGSAFWSYC